MGPGVAKTKLVLLPVGGPAISPASSSWCFVPSLSLRVGKEVTGNRVGDDVTGNAVGGEVTGDNVGEAVSAALGGAEAVGDGVGSRTRSRTSLPPRTISPPSHVQKNL